MLRANTFYDLISGRQTGWRAALARGALRLAEPPYRAAVAWRNWRYDRRHTTIHRPPVPVVSVGNLTVGGTGKTPLVKHIARFFDQQGVRIAILSRGYGADGPVPNDEARELALGLPDVIHLQDPDRVATSRVACHDFQVGALVLDDGFQHRRLARDLDIVLLDALQPFGFGHLLPRGALREPCASLRRADVVVLSRADLIDSKTRGTIANRAKSYAPDAHWCEIRHSPWELVNQTGARRRWQDLVGKQVAAFCGLGNPAGFRATLQQCGYEIAAWREYPDHYKYRLEDAEDLELWFAETGVEALLCTLKDLVKLEGFAIETGHLWALGVETQFLTGGDKFHQMLARVLTQGLPESADWSPQAVKPKVAG